MNTPVEALGWTVRWFNRQGYDTRMLTLKGGRGLPGLHQGRTFPVILLEQEGRPRGIVVVKFKRDGAVVFHKTGERTTGWDADLHRAFLYLDAEGLPVIVNFVHLGDGEARMSRIRDLPIANTWEPPRGHFGTGSHFVRWEELPLRVPLETPA